MINVSNDFKTRTKKIKQQNIKLGILNGELTVKEVHFMPVNVFNKLPVWMLRKRQEVIAKELKYSFDGKLFKTIMKQIEITVKNAVELKDKNVNFKYGIYVNNKFEYIDLGDFYIKDIDDDKGKKELVVTGYDKMIHFMKTFKQSDLQLTYPCTMLTLIQKMCEVCGVELYSTDFFYADLQVDEDYFTAQELTYRDVLEKVAESTETTIFIKDNKLYLHKLADNPVEKLDASYLTGLTVKEKFGPVNALVLGRGDVEDNVEAKDDTSIAENGRCEIRFDENEFVEYKREQVIDEMFEQIKGLEYYAFEGSDVGVMWLEPCDLIEVEDNEESTYKTIYLKANITINTGISSDIETDIPEETNTEYKVTTKEEKKTLKVERLAKKNEGLIQDLIEETTEQGQKLTEVEQTIDGITQTVSSVETKVETIEETANTAIENADEIKKQTIYAVDVMYALSNSSTEAPTTGWSTTAPNWENGKYMWQKTVITYGDGTTEETSVTCITGATGEKGENGKDGTDGKDGADGQKGDTGTGVKEIVEQYYLSTSNTTQTGGSWKTTQDTWSKGKYIWTRNKITWTDDTVSYTIPILATGLNNANSVANNANTTANTANSTANSAKDTADEAKETADNAINQVTTTTQKLTQVEQTVDGITQTVSEVEEKVETVEAKADNAQETADNINTNLTQNYYTKTETNSQIQQTANSITSSVSASISEAKQEAIDSANSNTDDKLQDYSTTTEMNSVIEQKANEITTRIDEMQDITETVSGTKIITLENCVPGALLELHIYGNNQVFKHLYPSDDLYPSNNLYPYGDSRIIVSASNGETEETTSVNIYELGVTDVLRQNGTTKDEYVLKDGKAQVIRRINKDGTIKAIEEIEDLGEFFIELKDVENVIEIKNYSAEIEAKYAIQNDYTDIYATKVEMSSSIKQTAEEINLTVSKKVGEDEVIASINASAEEVRN